MHLRTPTNLHWFGLIALSALFVSIILGQTVFYPFFTIDDSDVLDRAQSFLDEHGWKAYIKAYAPNVAINRRYWPGFYEYILLRTHLFGFSSIKWHLCQNFLYCAIGVVLGHFSKITVGSIWPGLIAFLTVLTAGEFTYQSIWFSYVFTNSFEPLLLFLWAASALLIYFSLTGSNAKLRYSSLLTSIAIVTFSITVKENAFLVVGGTFLILFVLSYWKAPRLSMLRWPSLLAAVAAAAWGAWVYSIIPKDAGYAGTSSLVTSPVQIYQNGKSYAELIYGASGFLVPIGLVLGISRIITCRAFDLQFALCVYGAVLQIASVLIWPDISLRLILPAFVLLVYVSVLEVFRFIKVDVQWLYDAGVIIGVLVTLSLYWIASGYTMLWKFLPIAIIIFSVAYRLPLKPLIRNVAYGSTVLLVAVTAIGLMVNGISHIVSYPVLYKTTELTRHLTVRNAAAFCPQNAKVVWFVDPGQEIFPYSCDIHARIFFDRPDLEIMPHTALTSETETFDAGDMIVLYGSHARELPFRQLTSKPIVQSGYLSPILSYRNFNSRLKSTIAAEPQPIGHFENFYEGTIHTYMVAQPGLKLQDLLASTPN